MGERRAGLRRVGFRGVGSADDGGGTGGGAVGWIADVASRMIEALGIDPVLAVVLADDFVAPGGGPVATTGTDFGAAWTRVAGQWVSHGSPGGAFWQGGVAVIGDPSGAWTDNHLLSAGPGLTKSVATDLWGFATRVYRASPPAPNPFNTTWWGAIGTVASREILVGVDESTDATHLVMRAATVPTVVSSYLSSQLDTAFREAMILVGPDSGGVQQATAYMDAQQIATITPAFNDMYRPYIGCNKGLCVYDAVVMVCESAIP
jgi:hypothetical protein